MKRPSKNQCFALFCTLMIALLLSGCAKTEAEPMDQVLVVDVQTPQANELALNSTFVSTVSPTESVSIIPLVAGEVTEVLVEAGDTVEAGQTLARLDDDAAQLQLASASAAYNAAKLSAAQATGAALDVQKLQTESSIRQLQASIDSYHDQIATAQKAISKLKGQIGDLQDSQDELEDKEDDLSDGIKQAEKDYAAAAKQYNTALAVKGQLQPALDLLNITTQTALLAQANADLLAYSGDAEAQLDDFVTDTEFLAVSPAASCYAALSAAGLSVENLTEANLTLLGNQADLYHDTYTSLSGYSTTASSGAVSVESAITQYEMSVDQYEAAIDQYEAAIATYKENLQTARSISDLTYGPALDETQQALDAQLDAAAVGVSSARLALDYYTLTTPIAGVVETVNLTKHGLAASGYAAFTISNTDTMTVTFSVSQAVRDSLVIGRELSAERNGQQYSGAITEIASAATPGSGLFRIKAAINASGDELLSGTSVIIRCDTRISSPGSLLIPYDCIYYSDGAAYVYCLSDGTARKTPVTVELFDETTAAISSGLSADAQVITSWSPRLRDGAAVKTAE